MKKKYEYAIATVDEEYQLQSYLDKMSTKGWRCVSAFPITLKSNNTSASIIKMIFERKVGKG